MCDRFFTGQNGRTSCTPHNPFSLSKTRAVAAASAARKLDLSLIHDSSVESRGGVFDMSKHLQQDNVDVIEQSPVKDTCDGYIEDPEKTSISDDEVVIIESPSSTPADENVKLSDDELESKEDCKINQCLSSRSEQENVSTIDEDESINHENSIEILVEQTSIPKKLGHRDLKEFAFIRRSERDRQPPQNSRSFSLPTIGDNISRTPNRKVMSSEDFLCPLECKKYKTVATENEPEESIEKVNFIQEQGSNTDTKIKNSDPKSTKKVSPFISKVSFVPCR